MSLSRNHFRFASTGILLGVVVAFSFGAAPSQSTPKPVVAAFAADTSGDIVNLQDQFRSVSERAARSIVAITVLPTLPERASELYAGPVTGDKLSEIAGTVARNVGSGFAISSDGGPTHTIVTSEHVVSGAAAVFVTLDDGRALPALVVGTDPRGDVAILRIPSEVPGLVVADSASVRRGDWCLTVGNPAGLAGQGGLTASVGTVGAIHRSLPALSRRENRSYSDLIQISTPIAPGNSGGPALNLRGEVLGIVCAVVPPGTQGQGVGFAMPLHAATLGRIDLLTRGDEVIYPYLGVNVSDIPFEDPRTRLAGVRVEEIDARAPAEGFIQRGDVVLSINGHPIPDDDAFSRAISESAVDEALLLKVLRSGEQVEIKVKPRKRELVAPPVTKFTAQLYWNGATFRTKFDAAGKPAGVTVVSLDPNCRFARAGLKPGDAFTDLLAQPTPDVVTLLDVLWKQAAQP
jgi:serine protease Do